jgi:hypothetical protein
MLLGKVLEDAVQLAECGNKCNGSRCERYECPRAIAQTANLFSSSSCGGRGKSREGKADVPWFAELSVV